MPDSGTLETGVTAWLSSHVAVIVIGLVVLNIFLRDVWSPLRRIPGPWLARKTKLWKLYQARKGDMEWTNIRLHQQYGPIVRMSV